MRPILLALFAFFALPTPQCWATPLSDGLQAFESGDYESAVKLLRPPADIGFRDAQFYLGYMYQTGLGTEKNYSEAVKWYRMAIDNFDPRAQLYLGEMYSRGEGVPQNYEEAYKLFLRPAELGYARAQHNLGIMFKQNQGIPKKWFELSISTDYVQAHKWLNLAVANYAASDHEDRIKVARARDEVEAKMTSDQIAKAQKLAKEWQPARECSPRIPGEGVIIGKIVDRKLVFVERRGIDCL